MNRSKAPFGTKDMWHCFELKNYMPFHALH